ncbi:aminoglycoside phosphotransferase, partial [Streptomyces sp. SPB78]
MYPPPTTHTSARVSPASGSRGAGSPSRAHQYEIPPFTTSLPSIPDRLLGAPRRHGAAQVGDGIRSRGTGIGRRPYASRMASSVPFAVPARFAEGQRRYEGEAGAAFVAAAPAMAARRLERWSLRPEGRVRHGVAALVLPVRTSDGEQAVLKAQLRTDETAGEGAALRAWDGDGAVRVLAEDREDVGSGPEVSWLLLERLDAVRDLNTVPDVRAALRPLAALLARLTAVRAPAGLRRLDDV